jgi:hypothetical protein
MITNQFEKYRLVYNDKNILQYIVPAFRNGHRTIFLEYNNIITILFPKRRKTAFIVHFFLNQTKKI